MTIAPGIGGAMDPHIVSHVLMSKDCLELSIWLHVDIDLEVHVL